MEVTWGNHGFWPYKAQFKCSLRSLPWCIPGGSVDPWWIPTVSTLFVATKAMVCRRKATGNVAPVARKDQSPKDVDLAEIWMVGSQLVKDQSPKVGEWWMWFLMAMSNTAFSLGFSIFAIQGAESAAGSLQRQRDPPELCRPNRVLPGRSRPWDWWQGMKGMKGLGGP